MLRDNITNHISTDEKITDEEIEEKILEFSKRLEDLAYDKKSMGITITEQCEDMGFASSNLSKYMLSVDPEKKKIKPRIDQLLRIAKYYNVSLDYLFGLTDFKHPLDTDEGMLKRQIYEYTGLNENTISKCHENITETPRKHADISWGINLLVASMKIGFFEAFERYIHSSKIFALHPDALQFVDSILSSSSCDKLDSIIGELDKLSIDELSLAYNWDKNNKFAIQTIDLSSSFFSSVFLKSIEETLYEIKKGYDKYLRFVDEMTSIKAE